MHVLFQALAALLHPTQAAAHEAYVVPKEYFWSQIHQPLSAHAVDALENPHNVDVTIKITVGVLLLLTVNYLFRRTQFGERCNAFCERFAFYGPFFVRAAIAVAFFSSAVSWSFLGPELDLRLLPFPQVMRATLFAMSFCFAAGVLTELAAAVGAAVYLMGFFIFGDYLLTYLNYFGELVVLLLFGMRHWSVDAQLFGRLSEPWKHAWEKYETTIVRICYGIALVYAGVTVKLLHPELTTHVATEWNLMQFHWLFPRDPLLITFGAGLAEIAIGLFIIIGFELRLTVFISLFYITLSLLYFRELVWPHLMLYGISLNLIVQPEIFTIDHLLFAQHRRAQRWWKRPLEPHTEGKEALAKQDHPEALAKRKHR